MASLVSPYSFLVLQTIGVVAGAAALVMVVLPGAVARPAALDASPEATRRREVAAGVG